MAIQTEFEFELPMGFVDRAGNLHKHGTMRLATAMDEITPLNDMRVQSNEAYTTIILLSRVITSLGTLSQVTTSTIENLFTADMAYLMELYAQINSQGTTLRVLKCPHCNEEIQIDLANLGGES